VEKSPLILKIELKSAKSISILSKAFPYQEGGESTKGITIFPSEVIPTRSRKKTKGLQAKRFKKWKVYHKF
jgi:hypothetical protein